MSVLDGCHEARNAVTIEEVTCPHCGADVEVYVRDGLLATEVRCDACGHVFAAGNPDPKN